MQPLEDKYLIKLNSIATAIQASPVLEQYLDEEEDDLYNQLREEFEPQLSELHHEVAAEVPLQLNSWESTLLEDRFEGLYLPRVLGYAVLRGEINDQYKYVRPNDHFKDILTAICQSPHFDQIRKRIGQTIQVGFALSSDIWITNLMNQVENKRIRYFLQQQKNDRFWDINERSSLYIRYSRQFKNELYYSAEFPEKKGEMKANFSALRQFLLKRFEVGGDNSSLKAQIQKFLANKEFHGHDEYMEMMALYGNFIELTDEDKKTLKADFKRERASLPDFDTKYLTVLASLYLGKLHMDATHDNRMIEIIDSKVDDKISDYYQIVSQVHSKGYVHPDIMEAVKNFCDSHEGLSIETECLRNVIANYFERLVEGLSVGEYTEYFEITKIFGAYMQIFDNEKFNLAVERISMAYVRKLLKRYTDKRGRDYQDIKKFVSRQFVEFGFLKEKEAVELFKTRRKKKPEA
jgi:ribosomal protein S17E